KPSPPAVPQITREEYVTRLESSFDDERRDASWSTHKTRDIQDLLQADVTLRSALRSLDCRSQRCRLELRDDGTQEFSQALMLFTARIGKHLPMADYKQLEGAQIIYLSERNTALN